MDSLLLHFIGCLNSCHVLVYSCEFPSFNWLFALHYLTLSSIFSIYNIFYSVKSFFFLEPSFPLYSLYQFVSKSAEHSVTRNLPLLLSWFGSTVSVSYAFLFVYTLTLLEYVLKYLLRIDVWVIKFESCGLCLYSVLPLDEKMYIVFLTANSFFLEFLRNCYTIFKHPVLLTSLESVLFLSFLHDLFSLLKLLALLSYLWHSTILQWCAV